MHCCPGTSSRQNPDRNDLLKQGGAGPTLTAGKRIVTEIDRPEMGEASAVLSQPAFRGVAFALLLLRPVLRRDEFGRDQRQPARRLVPDDRGVRRERAGRQAGRAVPRGSRAAAVVLRCGCTSGSAARGCAGTGDGAAVCWRAICGISCNWMTAPRLPPSRQGTRWLNVLKTLVAYRLIDLASEWRLHRQWYEPSVASFKFVISGIRNLHLVRFGSTCEASCH